MNWHAALTYGLIWCALWGALITGLEILWPQLMLHTYPPALQEVIHLTPLAGKRKTAAFAVSGVGALALLTFVFWSVLSTYATVRVSFLTLCLHIAVMTMLWNLVDLLVMDWLIFCTLRPRYLVLPGSQGHPAYRDYRFHAVAFLKGCLLCAAGSLLLAVVAYPALRWWVW
ncbi:MAG: hypothetical protein EOM10_16965 [Opitutae bacterium]|nr:hypothetical protein [Opitutae bacterium]